MNNIIDILTTFFNFFKNFLIAVAFTKKNAPCERAFNTIDIIKRKETFKWRD